MQELRKENNNVQAKRKAKAFEEESSAIVSFRAWIQGNRQIPQGA